MDDNFLIALLRVLSLQSAFRGLYTLTAHSHPDHVQMGNNYTEVARRHGGRGKNLSSGFSVLDHTFLPGENVIRLALKGHL